MQRRIERAERAVALAQHARRLRIDCDALGDAHDRLACRIHRRPDADADAGQQRRAVRRAFLRLDWQATEKQRIYGERDLLVAEAIREGLWNKLDAPGLAAMAAVLVYEARRDEDFEPRIPKGDFARILDDTVDLWHDLDHLAKQHRLPTSSPLDPGIAFAMYRWASGAKLDTVLDLAGLLAGDFIRWCKQIIDILDQLVQVADGDLSKNAKDAIDKVKRGIVAYSFYA